LSPVANVSTPVAGGSDAKTKQILWHISPIAGIYLLVTSAFVILETLERIVRKKEDAVDAVTNQSSAVTTA